MRLSRLGGDPRGSPERTNGRRGGCPNPAVQAEQRVRPRCETDPPLKAGLPMTVPGSLVKLISTSSLRLVIIHTGEAAR